MCWIGTVVRWAGLRSPTHPPTHPCTPVSLLIARCLPACSACAPGVPSWGRQSVPEGCVETQKCPLFQLGATAWYFVQGLAERGVTVPIGILDTAIGGQRIEEFMVRRCCHCVVTLCCGSPRLTATHRSATRGYSPLLCCAHEVCG
jgi:hypothetical protein